MSSNTPTKKPSYYDDYRPGASQTPARQEAEQPEDVESVPSSSKDSYYNDYRPNSEAAKGKSEGSEPEFPHKDQTTESTGAEKGSGDEGNAKPQQVRYLKAGESKDVNVKVTHGKKE